MAKWAAHPNSVREASTSLRPPAPKNRACFTAPGKSPQVFGFSIKPRAIHMGLGFRGFQGHKGLGFRAYRV